MNKCNENNITSFEKVSVELGIKLSHDTHYDASNYQYSFIIGREIHKLDFQPTLRNVYEVTKIIEIYPFLPKMFRFLYMCVPFFPYVAKVKHQVVGELPVTLESKELELNIREFVQSAL